MDFADAPNLGTFDRVVSVGMMEHVGIGRLQEYAHVFRKVMAPNGRGLCHTIYKAVDAPEMNEWIALKIFPGTYVPNERDMADCFLSVGLQVEVFHHIPGIHYAKTLDAWRERLNEKWDSIKHHFADPEWQKRKMDFYLGGTAAWFRYGRQAAVAQLELVPA
jgi:cyclopropane-fatty-acyl-phospholipid synthase